MQRLRWAIRFIVRLVYLRWMYRSHERSRAYFIETSHIQIIAATTAATIKPEDSGGLSL